MIWSLGQTYMDKTLKPINITFQWWWFKNLHLFTILSFNQHWFDSAYKEVKNNGNCSGFNRDIVKIRFIIRIFLKILLSTVFDIWLILTDIILDKIIENSTKGLKFDKIGLKLNRGKMNEIIRGSLVSLVILFSTHQRFTRSVHMNRKTESFL